MATRVFELARELDVTSKVILEKCRAEGLNVKNHMAVLSAGLEATVREWFTEGAAATAVETAQHVDLQTAHAQAHKARRRRKKDEAAEEAVVAEAPPEGERAPASAEAAGAVAVAPSGEASAVETVAAPAPAEEAVAAPAAETPAAKKEAVTAPLPAAAAAPSQEAEATAPPPAEGAKVEAAHARKAAPAKPPEKEIKQEVGPAGPQVVPRPAQLKGPRVVRVERPDFVPAPPAGRAPTGVARPPTGVARPPAVGPAPAKRVGKGPVVEEEEEHAAARKKTKRSPRRRGGRSADSGEKIKEWRDQDLLERSERLAAAGGLRRHRASVARQHVEAAPGVKGGPVEIEEPITVKSLSAATGIKAADIIKRLLQLDVKATVNQVIDRETAEAAAVEYGVELVTVRAKTDEEVLIDKFQSRPAGPMVMRAPVVTFLGHVDHGKTSLLDRIRKTNVASGEAGGITQAIGAYRYDLGEKHVVFLDTPGHEAFTAMRARGANMTDVVVLVVAADDGVMPQTIEAINHARAAKVPIVVALNKIDMPNANIQRAMGQLAEHGLNPREWGGDVEVIQTSAVTGQGVDTLIETLSLEAELLELRAETDAPASGFVIEAEMDPGLGVLARLLVRSGTLRVGDILLAGKGYGRVRHMLDSHGLAAPEAGPSTPVEAAGLDELPEAGDRFFVVENQEEARAAAEDRQQRARQQELAKGPGHSMQDLLDRIEAGEANELPLIIKADVQGSVEALVASLEKLNTGEVRVNILHAAAGGISTGDIRLAEASDAIVIGFNVVPDAAARQLAEELGVDVRLYRVIYDIIDDVRTALEEGLEPELREEVIGHAQVRQTFKISRVGTVAGCYVTDGLAQRSVKVRVTRNNIVIEDGRALASLRRFKDDVREVRSGMECGLTLEGYDDIKEGDVLEFYQQVEVARRL